MDAAVNDFSPKKKNATKNLEILDREFDKYDRAYNVVVIFFFFFFCLFVCFSLNFVNKQTKQGVQCWSSLYFGSLENGRHHWKKQKQTFWVSNYLLSQDAIIP